MRQKLAALMMSLLLLTSCGAVNAPDGREAALRRNYSVLTDFSATVRFTADYGERAYTYDASAQGNLTEGSLTVTAPESIAGTGFSWSEGTGEISYDRVILDTGELSPDGLSPSDALPVIFAAITTGKLISAGEEQLAGEETICLELSNPVYPDAQSTVNVWLAEDDGALRRAEIFWDGTRVVTCEMTEFSYTYQEIA